MLAGLRSAAKPLIRQRAGQAGIRAPAAADPQLPAGVTPPSGQCRAVGARAAGQAAMGQRSIDSFFKKPAALGKPCDSVRGGAAAAAAGAGGPAQEAEQQEQQAGAAPADEVPAPAAAGSSGPKAAAAVISSGAAAAGPAGAGAAGGASPLPTSPVETSVLQMSEVQRFRALANKNLAQAKQVVIAAEREGGVPGLGDLLVEPSWRQLLHGELSKPYFKDLESFVQGEWRGGALVFPPKDCIFRALNSCPVEHVKVVILGQDPYHGLGQAMGLSFSVPQAQAVPSSLRNMYKELRDDLGCPPGRHGNLEKWAQQGVLLLNAVLTVRASSPASHARKGWEQFTDRVIAQLSQERKGLVFMLWGRYAQDKGKHIDKKRHHVLTAAHPSGLSASRGFFGCRHFSQANALLAQEGQLPIDWCIE